MILGAGRFFGCEVNLYTGSALDDGPEAAVFDDACEGRRRMLWIVQLWQRVDLDRGTSPIRKRTTAIGA